MATTKGTMTWRQFVLEYGWRADGYELAAVLGVDITDIQHLRSTIRSKRLAKRKRFGELFALWHGRPPKDSDWPPPRRLGKSRTYEWQEREIALLATLVGVIGIKEIAATLTARLRKVTRDPRAARTRVSVQVRINAIGLQSADVLGGITTSAAGREIGSRTIINHALRNKTLRAVRRGRLWVIPHDVWKAWKATRIRPPKGYVKLSSIREALSIRSDKLSEFARMGFVPTAICCNATGQRGSNKFGIWYVDKKIADQMVADRRAGRPMPWHGKPLLDNLRITFRLWTQRKHPTPCKTCQTIWGKKGAPRTFDDYIKRYPPLDHGAKRHLTMKFSPGMTVPQIAKVTGRSAHYVRRAIRNGVLEATKDGREYRVSRTQVTLWKARKCSLGTRQQSWLALDTACKQYLFTRRDLRKYIREGKLKTRLVNGVEHVLKQQCRRLREKVGFSEEEAARRVGVTVGRLRVLLDGVNWRKRKGIPLETVQAAIKRLQSRQGYTLEEAAKEVRKTVQWVRDRIDDGTIRVLRTKWDHRRIYISEPMLKRLKDAKRKPVKRERFDENWLLVGEAAMEAAVSASTLARWGDAGELKRKKSSVGWRYHRQAVRARARRYWRSVRFRRATPPAWLNPAEVRKDMRK